MPTVTRLPGGLRVRFHYVDHDPPHFHVERDHEDVVMRIADLRLLEGSLDRGHLLNVLRWARDHQAELAMNWVLARAELNLWDIPFP